MPHSGAADEEVEETYDKIEEIGEKEKKGAFVILMDDWNAVVEKEKVEEELEDIDWEKGTRGTNPW